MTYVDTLLDGEQTCYLFLVNAPFEDTPGAANGYAATFNFDSEGNFYHTYTDDFGNTTGYDSSGNYYSAHTDDFGNSTIDIY